MVIKELFERIDINEDIENQIELILYDEYNDEYCSIYENIGNVYSLQDLEDLQASEISTKLGLYKRAAKQLQQELSKYKKLYNKAIEDSVNTSVELMKYKEINENLNNMVANKIISDYDIDTPLKELLNKERLEHIAEIDLLNIELSKYKEALKQANKIKDIQGSRGNYNFDNYMLGMYNGMEYVISLFEEREPQYIDGHNVKFLNEYGDKYKVRLEKCRKQKSKVENACHNYKVIIEKAIEFVKTQYNTYPSAEEWRKALLKILEVEDD